LFDNRLTIV